MTDTTATMVEHNANGEHACTECGHQGTGQVPGCTCPGCDDTGEGQHRNSFAELVTDRDHPRPPTFRVPSYQVPERTRCSGGPDGGFFDMQRMPPGGVKAMPPGQIYRLDICRDGTLTVAVHPEQKPFNKVAIRALFTTDLPALQAAQRTVGRLQSDTEPKTLHRIDAGQRWIFGWGLRTGTLAQVDRMGDVIWLLMQGRRQEAIDLAWFYDRLAASEDPAGFGEVYR